MELESSQSPMLRISSVNSASNTTAIDTNISIDCNDDMSVSESSCSYTVSIKQFFIRLMLNIYFTGSKKRTRR